ncbi:M48 family metallopeptidase [Iningainema tapete]|uniref:M48 family metallopeptidase n=1 Tax=Iningainema tapete BLCC-T55 TaxID=2748662 RepID=A0A8J6XZY7_9CYAN|nr:M48 family metallopeptidase [Iningainema tapete]MBD2776443.1 M48 family metallopeptidase [Iningainema tapete BLCC-T55]
MMSSRISQKFICQTLGITASLLSLLSNQSFAYSAPPSSIPNQTSSKSNLLAIEDEKPIYPVAEKLIRANGLDDYPWRIKVEEDDDDNAHASNINQVTISKGLLDKLYGDEAGIAFIIGHEIAHNTQRHTYMRTAFEDKLSKQLLVEANAEVQNLIAEEKRKFSANKNISRGKMCRRPAVVKKTSVSATEYRVLNCQGQLDTDKIERVKLQIFAKKQQEFESAIKKLSRQQEFEADALGYMYMVRAGYDPEGALRVLNLMTRLPYHDADDSTHPSFIDRINAIKELMKKYPVSTLVAEGAIRLRQNPQPLTFDVSNDGESLRINSRFGSQQTQPKTDS